MTPWRRTGDHLVLHVRATPRAGRDAVEGVETLSDGKAALRVRLKAAPADGEANEALRRLLRHEFGVRLDEVEIIGGATSRRKTIRLPVTALAALESLLADR